MGLSVIIKLIVWFLKIVMTQQSVGLMAVGTQNYVTEFIVRILHYFAQSSENKLDDELVKMVAKALNVDLSKALR